MAPLWSASETRTLLNAWRDSVDPQTQTQSLYARFVELMDGRSTRTEVGVLARRDALKFMWLLITEFHRAEEQSEVQRSWFALPVWEKRAVFGKKTNGRMNSYIEVQHDTFVVLDAILSTTKRRRTSPIRVGRDSSSTLGFIASRAPPVPAAEPAAPTLSSSSSSSSTQRNPIVLHITADDSGSSTESDEDFVAMSAIPSLRRAAASQASSSSPIQRDTSASASPPRHKRRKLALPPLTIEDTAPASQPRDAQPLREPRRENPAAHGMDEGQSRVLARSTLLDAQARVEPRSSALSIASLLSSSDTAVGASAPGVAEPALGSVAPASPATVSTSEDDDYEVPTATNSSSNNSSSRRSSAMALSQSLQAPSGQAVFAPLSSHASMSFIVPAAPLKRSPVVKTVDPGASMWLHHVDGAVDVAEFIALVEAQATELQALYREFQHHKQLEETAQRTFKALVERDQRDQQHVLRSIRTLEARVASETGQWTSSRALAAPRSQEHEDGR